VRLKQAVILITSALLLLSALAIAGDKANKEPNKNLCEVIVRPTDKASHFEIEINLTNDEPIAAASFPFSIAAGDMMMYYDSISFAGSRAEFCAAKIPNPDTANQRFNLGLLASMTPPLKFIDPGQGTIAKLYYTGEKGVGLQDIIVDTVFFPPSNHLMGVLPDAKTNVYPGFKFTREPKKK